MSEDGIISGSAEATAVGFKAVQKVTGLFASLTRKESKFKNEDGSPSKDQVELSIEDAIILEMQGGQPIPELKEDRFVDWMPYANKDEQPTKQSGFVRGFVKSAEKLQETQKNPGKGWREYLGQIITLEKKELTWTFNKGTDKEEVKTALVWHFVDNEDLSEALDDYVVKTIAGKTPQMAARDLMLDTRTKNNVELRNTVKAGQPAAGLEVVDGKYTNPKPKVVEEPAEDV